MSSNCPDIAKLKWAIRDNKTMSVRFIHSNEWGNDMRIRANIAIFKQHPVQLVNAKIFEYNPSDIGKYGDFCSFDFCKRYMINGTLKIVCSARIIGEFPYIKSEILMNLSDDFGSLLFNGTLSDMTLSAGGQDYAVHKLVLAARSPVFGAMFENKDCKEVQEGRITIEDMSSDVCELMLRHIYTGSIPYDMNQYAFDLFVAADKYQLTQLKSVCENALISLLDVNSVCTVG